LIKAFTGDCQLFGCEELIPRCLEGDRFNRQVETIMIQQTLKARCGS
jgi:hypothetical protein